MTQNKLSDLNNHLFMALERLNDEILKETERAKAITNVAGKIIDNGRLILDAQKVSAEFNGRKDIDLELLNG
ncbi:hypothetical protein [Streptococcus hyointestinalis]|uniref:hypothetical protein n=1 Tax=Streptococcus hyointestinalis TaxID=1337 RepID=UPI003CFC1862